MQEEKKTGVDEAEFLSALGKKVKETGRRFAYKIRELGLMLADAFSGRKVKSFTVDFDPAHRAIAPQVELPDGDMLCLHSETGNKAGIVDVAILRDGNLIFTGTDRLDTLKGNLKSLFKEEAREDPKDKTETRESGPKDDWRKKALTVRSLLEMLERGKHPDEEVILALSDDIGDVAKVRSVGQQCTGDGEIFYELLWKPDRKPLTAGSIMFDICWSLSHHEFKDDIPVIVWGGVRYGSTHYVTDVTNNGEAVIIRCGKIEDNQH